MAINTGPSFGGPPMRMGGQNNAGGGGRTTNATGRQTQTQNGPGGMAPAGPSPMSPTPGRGGAFGKLMGLNNRMAMAPINPLIHPINSARSFGNALIHPPGSGALGRALFGGGGFQNLPAGPQTPMNTGPRPMNMPPQFGGGPVLMGGPPNMGGGPIPTGGPMMGGPPSQAGPPNMPAGPQPVPPIAAGMGNPMAGGSGGGMGPLFNRYNQMSAGVPGRQLVY